MYHVLKYVSQDKFYTKTPKFLKILSITKKADCFPLQKNEVGQPVTSFLNKLFPVL